MIMSITLVWTIILVIAVIVEAITIDLVSIWFGIGAIAALICHFFGVGEVLQIVILRLFPLSVLLPQDHWLKNTYVEILSKQTLIV